MRAIASHVLPAVLLVLAALYASPWHGHRAAADAPRPPVKIAHATFAGGCFWCVEAAFDRVPGVLRTTSGYTGGQTDRPTYQQVGQGDTGHAEAVLVVFDASRVSYRALLWHFWRNIDPTVKDRQFCDTGSQYRSAIFYHGDAQGAAARASREALLRSRRFARVHTEIKPAARFWPAEAHHQDFHRKQPQKYLAYRRVCGRELRLRQLWRQPAAR